MKDFFVEAKKIENAKDDLVKVFSIANTVYEAIAGLSILGVLGLAQLKYNIIKLIAEADDEIALKCMAYAIFGTIFLMALSSIVELALRIVSKIKVDKELLYKITFYHVISQGFPGLIAGVLFMAMAIYVMVIGHNLMSISMGIVVFFMGLMAFASGLFHVLKNVVRYQEFQNDENPFQRPSKKDRIFQYIADQYMLFIGGCIFITGGLFVISIIFTIPDIELFGILAVAFFALLIVVAGGFLIWFGIRQYEKYRW